MTAMRPAQRLRLPGTTGGAIRVARVAGLVALLWAVASQHSDGEPRVPAAPLVVTAAGWVGWLICLQVRAPWRQRSGEWFGLRLGMSHVPVPREVYLREISDADVRDLDDLASLAALGIWRPIGSPSRDVAGATDDQWLI